MPHYYVRDFVIYRDAKKYIHVSFCFQEAVMQKFLNFYSYNFLISPSGTDAITNIEVLGIILEGRRGIQLNTHRGIPVHEIPHAPILYPQAF